MGAVIAVIIAAIVIVSGGGERVAERDYSVDKPQVERGGE